MRLSRDPGRRHPGYRVVGKADCANTALELVARHVPDVIIMDLSRPGDIFETISEMATRFPTTSIVIFTAYSSIDAALKALQAGAKCTSPSNMPCR